MVAQLSKRDDREAVAKACMEAVYRIEKPTTQEQILIDALAPKQKETIAAPLFTEADRYVPTVEIGEYERDCIRSFMEVFPDSKLEKQVMAGKQITHNTIRLPTLPCAGAKNAQKNLKSLSDFLAAHERDTYTHFSQGVADRWAHLWFFHVAGRGSGCSPDGFMGAVARRE